MMVKMTAEELKSLIENNMADTEAHVQSDDNVHFEAIVISEQFRHTPNRVKQQRLVYEALTPHIHNGAIHALALKTYSPQAWAKTQNA